jgi:hypothetical protein
MLTLLPILLLAFTLTGFLCLAYTTWRMGKRIVRLEERWDVALEYFFPADRRAQIEEALHALHPETFEER